MKESMVSDPQTQELVDQDSASAATSVEQSESSGQESQETPEVKFLICPICGATFPDSVKYCLYCEGPLVEIESVN